MCELGFETPGDKVWIGRGKTNRPNVFLKSESLVSSASSESLDFALGKGADNNNATTQISERGGREDYLDGRGDR
jgi:hypothetical protein